MHFGVSMFFTDYSMGPAELGRALEERGFESVWAPEHSHIPLSRATPFPPGGDLPKKYYDVMDPFVTLSAAAAATTKLKIGTGICLVVQRDPIQTAKSVASLDHVSGGRFLFGVGAGWNAEEMAHHGTPFERRFRVLRERIEAMKALWSEERAEYHGEFVDFEASFAWPKPVQKPSPPIHVGGTWPGAARRAIAWGDGWIPVGDLAGAAGKMAEFRKLAEEAGRDPSRLEVSVYYCPPEPGPLGRAREAGIARAVFGVPPEPRDKVLPLLDRLAAVAKEVG
jgi:probable F420-dependent oxidoreductase